MTDRITVRMYRVGFGDCFLLRFWTGRTAAKVLIDCGSITEGQGQVDRVARDIVETCRDPDGVPRLALVVATHRHKDHVGGFANAVWDQVEAGQVWMPWTEDPGDARAAYIRSRQSALAASLAPAARDQDPLAATPPRGAAAAALAGVHAMALNALTNEKAMATLHGGFAKRVTPVFLPRPDSVCEGRAVPGIDGVTVHVLGPPRDETAMKVMDPPTGKAYLAGPTGLGGPSDAFGSHWRIDEAGYRTVSPGSTFSAEDMQGVNRNADQPGGELAAALDNAVNNTSLILMFEAGDQFLLFPGDAQWGAWNAALQDPASRALLARTNFYKVGHHGSHNATPKELIADLVQPPFVAMFSTCHVPQWPDIPRTPLVDAIAQRAVRYARSDDEAEATAAGFTVQAGLYVEFDIPIPTPAGPPAIGKHTSAAKAVKPQPRKSAKGATP
jgi:beta-lactamase superfamily II metal-dependent hydrolase